MVLVVVDSHSKWIEAFPVYTANSQNTIENLRPLFAQFGFPETCIFLPTAPFSWSQIYRNVSRLTLKFSIQSR